MGAAGEAPDRRAEVSRKAAERYLDAFASVEEDATLEELIRRLGQPKQWRGRRVRALRPFAEGHALLEAVSRGEFALNGFRNRDRKLRLLRAHALITKVNGTHRYQLTAEGRKSITAILTALRSTVRQLTSVAA